ncbi:MAG: N-acetyltransferase [Eubacteriales bacterium]|nr:N-acetyltransferase [Eubacteriales bacterium]
MSYVIRKAVRDDLPRILEIYAYARAFMAKTGNPSQWGTGNPPVEQTVRDIETGRLYAAVRGERVHGVFFFTTEPDPTYAVIYDGAWHSSGPYGVIHRIAGDGSGGVVAAAVAFARTRAACLRIDTHRDNRVMQHTLEKNGFQYCGIIHLANGDPRLAYDLIT